MIQAAVDESRRSGTSLLEVRDLCVDYVTDKGAVRAVDRVSLSVAPGEFLGIVGESGCGKSTLLYAIARLLGPPAEIASGSIRFRGDDMVTMGEEELRHIRWQSYSVVMQSAMNALNPVMTIGSQLGDAIRAHQRLSRRAVRARSEEVMRLVGIDPVHLKSFPHQLSGGMRQRSMIAMALVFTPELVIMDEPTSALDVVAQRSLMLQIKELQRKIGFAAIFVTHDAREAMLVATRIGLLREGRLEALERPAEFMNAPGEEAQAFRACLG